MKHAVCTSEAEAAKFKAVIIEELGLDAWNLRFEPFAQEFLRKS